MKTDGMHLSWIVVKDLKAAIKFYTEVVGLILREQHDEFGWAELSGPNGASLGLAQETPEARAGSNAVVTITVENIEKARDEFLRKNVHLIGDILEIPGHVKMQTFTDQDGNMFQLCEQLGS